MDTPIDITAGEEVIYKNRFAKYRAKNREMLNEKARLWREENGDAWREENSDRIKEYNRIYRERHRERIRQRLADFRAENYETCLEYERKYRKNNPEKVKASGDKNRNKPETKAKAAKTRKLWQEKNKDKLTAKAAARRALKFQATPAWADLEKIEEIYAEARRLSLETGVIHHVDHVVPLKSKWVCGLHVEANLEIVPGVENLSKGNRIWPDMWEENKPGSRKREIN